MKVENRQRRTHEENNGKMPMNRQVLCMNEIIFCSFRFLLYDGKINIHLHLIQQRKSSLANVTLTIIPFFMSASFFPSNL